MSTCLGEVFVGFKKLQGAQFQGLFGILYHNLMAVAEHWPKTGWLRPSRPDLILEAVSMP